MASHPLKVDTSRYNLSFEACPEAFRLANRRHNQFCYRIKQPMATDLLDEDVRPPPPYIKEAGGVELTPVWVASRMKSDIAELDRTRRILEWLHIDADE